MTPEGKVKKVVDTILKRHATWYFKPVSSGYGTHGIPDYICCVHGWFLAIECKATDAKKPTELQQAVLDRIRDAGGVVYVATPGSLRELEAILVALVANMKSIKALDAPRT